MSIEVKLLEAGSDDIASFEISTTTGLGTCKVVRLEKDINELHQYVITQIPDLNPCTADARFEAPYSVEGLQIYLSGLVAKLADAFFVCPMLLNFLDDEYGKSEIFKLQTDYFFCQVSFCYK